jgi:CPA2 family monovalent cation:H+ antiporter-2
MTHDISLITTIAAALGLALLCGLSAAYLKLPPLLGYLVAGMIVGPATPGFVADMHLAGQLAEIGVMLLMFGVGLHFSIGDLWAVRKIAIPGAIIQIAVATTLGAALAMFWGWPIGAGLVFGLTLSVASTVVLLRALEDRGILASLDGSIAVGWLVVEDLVTILVLVLLPPVANWLGGQNSVDPNQTTMDLGMTVLLTLAQVAAFIALMLIGGRRLLPWLLWQVAGTGSRELFTLCVIATAVGIAYGSSHLFGVSFALGAFFAGMVLRESELSHRAAEESLPLREAFSVLFFVSVGMLFDPQVIVQHPLALLAVVAVIIFGKSMAALMLVLIMHYPLRTALIVSASLAQIGEFSFILVALAISLHLLEPYAQSLVLGGAIISITVNPLLFKMIKPIETWLTSQGDRPWLASASPDPMLRLNCCAGRPEPSQHVVLVGYGRVGQRIAHQLLSKDVPLVVIEQKRELVMQLRQQSYLALTGDAVDPEVLLQARITQAKLLVIAIPDSFQMRTILEAARTLHPAITTVIRTHNEEQAIQLRKEKTVAVFMGEQELAVGMSRHILTWLDQVGETH